NDRAAPRGRGATISGRFRTGIERFRFVSELGPHLVAIGKVPPLRWIGSETSVHHEPIEQPPVGAGLFVGEREGGWIGLDLEAIGVRKWRGVVEQRAHPKRIAALPADGEIDGAAG